MKYIGQFGIIILFSLAGEACHALLPFPIPASLYGMVLMLLALAVKLVRPEQVKETGSFLVSILPLLFVAPTVGLMACWDQIKHSLAGIVIVIVLTTVLVFVVSGWLTKVLRKGGDDHG